MTATAGSFSWLAGGGKDKEEKTTQHTHTQTSRFGEEDKLLTINGT